MPDDELEKWDYPPHTRVKHQILASYIDGWFPILSRWNGRVLFLDGFAGRGRYTSNHPGSPIIALTRLLSHRYWAKMKHREFVFLFVESNRSNYESLVHEIEQFKADHAPWPSNVIVEVRWAEFNKAASDILAYLRAQKARLAPTFAFIDPFGYSGLAMETIADLLAYPSAELLVNFMVGHVNRFIEREGQERSIRELFGIDVRSVLKGFDGADRVAHLKNVYERQLRVRAKFDHVQSFAMRNSTGNIGYYLLYGTRHRLGVKLMKASMWKVDPGGGYQFSDRLAGLDVLFEPEPDLRPLRQAILSKFAGLAGVLIDDVEWFSILETPYRETHVRPILRELEKEGRISVARPGKTGFPLGTTRINFV